MQKFSDRLISLRKERGITQTNLAKVIQKKRSTVSGYECENKEPDLETICIMAKYFGVSADYMLGLSDRPNHTEDVFYNDTVNFKKHFYNLPASMRPVVAKCFDDFYRLLNRDMQLGIPERIAIYEELLRTVQSLRAEIQHRIDATGGAVTDPVLLSDLMALQSQLKNEVTSQLDRLMQADMQIAFNVKNDVGGVSSGKTAM